MAERVVVTHVRAVVALVSCGLRVGKAILRLCLARLLRVALLLILMMAAGVDLAVATGAAHMRHFHGVLHVVGSGH